MMPRSQVHQPIAMREHARAEPARLYSNVVPSQGMGRRHQSLVGTLKSHSQQQHKIVEELRSKCNGIIAKQKERRELKKKNSQLHHQCQLLQASEPPLVRRCSAARSLRQASVVSEPVFFQKVSD